MSGFSDSVPDFEVHLSTEGRLGAIDPLRTFSKRFGFSTGTECPISRVRAGRDFNPVNFVRVRVKQTEILCGYSTDKCSEICTIPKIIGGYAI